MMMHVFLQSSTKKTFQVTLVSEKGLTLLSATFYKNYSDNGCFVQNIGFFTDHADMLFNHLPYMFNDCGAFLLHYIYFHSDVFYSLSDFISAIKGRISNASLPRQSCLPASWEGRMAKVNSVPAKRSKKGTNLPELTQHNPPF